DLWIIGSGNEGGPARAAGITPSIRRTAGRQPEQTIDLLAPRVQLARRVGIRLDDAGGSSDTLQPDRLPHQQQFLVGRGWMGYSGDSTRNYPCSCGASRVNDDQVARLGGVNSSLDASARRDVGRRFAADRDGHGVDC